MKPGDIVQLKSGGPKMTVTEAREWNGEIRVWCSWFDEHNKPQSDSFPMAALKQVGV